MSKDRVDSQAASSSGGKYVFVSYSRKDQDRVLPIVERLRQSGVTAWIDQEGIDGASFWAEEIVNAIRGCTVFLFMISASSVDSSNTNRELALAAERNLPILPVYLSRAELPARTAYQLAGIHYIEMFDGPTDRALRAVLQALQRAGIELVPNPLRPGAAASFKPPRPGQQTRAAEPESATVASTTSAPPAIDRPASRAEPAADANAIAQDDVAQIVESSALLRETPMSRVYLGQRPGVGRVVLKVMRQIPPESEDWLRSELYRHVMGPRLVETGRLASGEMWVLTRHIDAVPLAELVRPDNVIVGALLDDLVLAVLEQLAILHGHERPVIHRDVTPGNLMLTFVDQTPAGDEPPAVSAGDSQLTVHLIDYEAACFADARQTPVGAPGFAPPEQIQGEAVLSSDLYSLVATAYFLATAQLPPNLARPGASLAKFPSGVWGTQTRLDERYEHKKLMNGWARDPLERPRSARQFLSEVQVPGTRLWTKAKPLGTFACGAHHLVELTDQSYVIRRSPK